MIREEKQKAINALRRSVPVMAMTHEEFDDYIKTLNKIMDYLEQEPCEDCISRQQAVDKMQELEDEDIKAYGCKIPEGFDGERAIEALEALQPVIPQLCTDAISRQEAIDTIESWLSCDDYNDAERHIMRAMQSILYDLQPVTPQPKYGKWIESKCYDDRDHFYICSECGRCINLICGAKLSDYPYCHCGAKMEVEENG